MFHEISAAQKNFGILDQVPVGVLILRRDYVVIFWNSCMEDWTGIPRHHMLGSDIRERFPRLSSPKYAGRLNSVFDGGPPTVFSSQLHGHVIPVQRSSGKLQIQHTIITPTPALDNSGSYAMFTFQDVTDLTYRISDYRTMRDQALTEVKERKRAETELLKTHELLEIRIRERTADLVDANDRLQGEIREREKMSEELRELVTTLNTVVDNIPEGIVLLDADYRIILANDFGRQYLGLLSGSSVGDSLTHIAEEPIEKLFIYSRNNIPHEIIGGEDIFEVTGGVIGQPEACRGIVIVIQKVTDKHNLMERINAQERLAAVGQLAAGIAHDFNNILTGIIGYTEIAMSENMPGGMDKEVIEAIQRNSLRAAHLIRQILDFSCKSSTAMRHVDLSVFLGEIIQFMQRTVSEHFSITMKSGAGDYAVLADPPKIQQILTNLILNAVDAMPEGGTIDVALSGLTIHPGDKPPVPDMPEGDWVVIGVSDRGTGIPSEVLPHIYEPFFTSKEFGKGTGLGLSQVYGIVKQHNGFIGLQTELNHGTSFSVYLPAAVPLEGFSEKRTSGWVFADGRAKTVLLVEDDKPLRDLLQRIMERTNFRILTAENGRAALEEFSCHQQEVDIVVTDLVMPDMDGMALSRTVKARKPSVIIIGMSGYPLGAQEENLKASGISGYLAKPFETQTLLNVIHKAIEESAT